MTPEVPHSFFQKFSTRKSCFLFLIHKNNNKWYLILVVGRGLKRIINEATKEVWFSWFLKIIFGWSLSGNLDIFVKYSPLLFTFPSNKTKSLILIWQITQRIFLKMSAPSEKIANQIKKCSFSLQSIEKFLALMATQ